MFMLVDAYCDPQMRNEPHRSDIHPHNARKRLAFGYGLELRPVQVDRRVRA